MFATPSAPVAQESGHALPTADGEWGLAELLDRADLTSPWLAHAEATARRADVAAGAASERTMARPELALSGGGRTVAGTTGLDVGVELSQELGNRGARDSRRAAIAVAREADEASVAAAEWTMHVRVHRLYADVLLADEGHQQAHQFVEFAERMRDVAARQVEAGDESRLVLLVADADLAAARHHEIDALEALRARRADLAAVIGISERELPRVVGELPSVHVDLDADSLVAQALEAHPALRAEASTIAWLESQVDVAATEGASRPTIGAGYERESSPGGGPGAHVWSATVAIPLPAWRPGASARAEADAALVAAEGDRAALAASLEAEIRATVIALEAAAARETLFAQGVLPNIEENLQLLERAYELGEVDIHQVSQMRERLLDTTAAALDARVAYFDVAAELEGLVGVEIWSDGGHQ